jgi:hypothetical protein
VLIELLTTIFFAGLATYEGEHRPIGVVFLGRSSTDVVIPDASGVALLYQWKIVRFETPRPFIIPELVKLAVAGAERPHSHGGERPRRRARRDYRSCPGRLQRGRRPIRSRRGVQARLPVDPLRPRANPGI